MSDDLPMPPTKREHAVLPTVDLAIGRAMCNLASPGPWEAVKSWPGQSFVERVHDGDGAFIGDTYPRSDTAPMAHTFDGATGSPSNRAHRNAEFIAYTRTALPIALAEIDRLRAVCQAAKAIRATHLATQKLTYESLLPLYAALDAAERGLVGDGVL